MVNTVQTAPTMSFFCVAKLLMNVAKNVGVVSSFGGKKGCGQLQTKNIIGAAT